jgi:hypothetical protein
VSVVALAGLLVVVAAGCGEKSASPEEQWASSVCTAFGDWKGQVQKSVDGVRSQLESPQQGMVTSIKSEVQAAVDATNKLASDLKSIPPVNSSEGATAKQEIDKLATQAESTMNQAKTTVNNLPESASASATLKALAPLAPQLQSLAAQASTTVSNVKAAGSSLQKGFEDAKSCKQFNS